MPPFVAAIALSAFLLFQIQPIVGKWLLPGFGGTPAVWTTCMAFFQTALLGGYVYAHVLARRVRFKAQVIVHLSLLALTALLLALYLSAAWQPASALAAGRFLNATADGPQLLLLLCLTVGLPFVVLSATAPLLQSWYVRRWPGRPPYRLYSLSNGASLLALLSYPFVIEPYLSLHAQAWAWGGGFILFALLCAAAGRAGLAGSTQSAPPARADGPAPAGRVMWFCLSACSSAVLLATTAHLSQDAAAAPFLWVLPLAIYLLTFVFCFERDGWYRRGLWVYALPPAVVVAAVAMVAGSRLSLLSQVAIHGTALFACCTVCNGELARLKPDARNVTHFYLTLAGGGAAGGLLVALAAPHLFNGYREYPLGLILTCVLLLVAIVRRPRPGERRPALGSAFVVTAALFVAVVALRQVEVERRQSLDQSRNFYGVLRVDQLAVGPQRLPARALVHGRIRHGIQLLDPQRRRQPTSYYGPDTGVSIAQAVLHARQPGGPVRMGIVGLGAGVAAVFGREGDAIRFYEINPEVVRLANQYFTFLHDTPARTEIIIGDARLSLERERTAGTRGNFDLLVLDAFSGDSPPLHLLTREAFGVYRYHLRAGGVMAVNVTNRYLDFVPLALGLAQDAGLSAVVIESQRSANEVYEATRWVLLTADQSFLTDPQVKAAAKTWPAGPPATVLFTDERTSLWPLLRRGVP